MLKRARSVRERVPMTAVTRAMCGPGKRARACLRWCLAWILVTCASATLVHEAEAQTITLDEARIERVLPYRQSRRWWINYEECVANDAFIFPLALSDPSEPVEVWAGSEDCAENRSRTERGQCWIVATEASPRDSTFITVPVRNIVARRLDTTAPPMDLSADVCEESSDPSGEQFTFYFIAVDGGRSIGTPDTWAGGPEGTGFDLVGPEPPGTIGVGIGENQLAISLNGVEEESDRERFEAFCVPAGTSGTVDAGADSGAASSDAGSMPGDTSGEGTPAPAECFTPLMRGGRRPPLGFSCGEVSETATRLRTSRLQNDTAYAVGVAGQDIVGNAGVLSAIQCGTPRPLDDFYELYSRNGGLGGGGFCSLRPAAPSSRRAPALALLGLLAAAFFRRRRGSCE